MKTFNEEQLKGIAKAGLRLGKAVVIEGTKAVILKGAVVAINASFDSGLEGVKSLTLGDVLKDEDKESKGLFRRKKKVADIEVDTEVTISTKEV